MMNTTVEKPATMLILVQLSETEFTAKWLRVLPFLLTSCSL